MNTSNISVEVLREYLDLDPIVPPKRAAAILGTTEGVLAVLRTTGTGPLFTRIGGGSGRVYYSLKDLKAWRDRTPRYRSTAEADAAMGLEEIAKRRKGAIALDQYRAKKKGVA